MVNDTEFKIIDTNEKSPLKLTTPEKWVSLNNISWTWIIEVTSPKGEKKSVQFIEWKIIETSSEKIEKNNK
jgi:hypothetical protein